MNPSAAVYLSDEESKRFMLFMKHYEVINTLIESGAFDIKNGYYKINIDGTGHITSIEINVVRRP